LNRHIFSYSDIKSPSKKDLIEKGVKDAYEELLKMKIPLSNFHQLKFLIYGFKFKRLRDYLKFCELSGVTSSIDIEMKIDDFQISDPVVGNEGKVVDQYYKSESTEEVDQQQEQKSAEETTPPAANEIQVEVKFLIYVFYDLLTPSEKIDETKLKKLISDYKLYLPNDDYKQFDKFAQLTLQNQRGKIQNSIRNGSILAVIYSLNDLTEPNKIKHSTDINEFVIRWITGNMIHFRLYLSAPQMTQIENEFKFILSKSKMWNSTPNIVNESANDKWQVKWQMDIPDKSSIESELKRKSSENHVSSSLFYHLPHLELESKFEKNRKDMIEYYVKNNKKQTKKEMDIHPGDSYKLEEWYGFSPVIYEHKENIDHPIILVVVESSTSSKKTSTNFDFEYDSKIDEYYKTIKNNRERMLYIMKIASNYSDDDTDLLTNMYNKYVIQEFTQFLNFLNSIFGVNQREVLINYIFAFIIRFHHLFKQDVKGPLFLHETTSKYIFGIFPFISKGTLRDYENIEKLSEIVRQFKNNNFYKYNIKKEGILHTNSHYTDYPYLYDIKMTVILPHLPTKIKNIEIDLITYLQYYSHQVAVDIARNETSDLKDISESISSPSKNPVLIVGQDWFMPDPDLSPTEEINHIQLRERHVPKSPLPSSFFSPSRSRTSSTRRAVFFGGGEGTETNVIDEEEMSHTKESLVHKLYILFTNLIKNGDPNADHTIYNSIVMCNDDKSFDDHLTGSENIRKNDRILHMLIYYILNLQDFQLDC
jgi:ubiquinone/menaquinone biosynthesis C-methylase UbiE